MCRGMHVKRVKFFFFFMGEHAKLYLLPLCWPHYNRSCYMAIWRLCKRRDNMTVSPRDGLQCLHSGQKGRNDKHHFSASATCDD